MAASVRARTTGVAVAVVAVALLIGGIALVAAVRERLTNDVRTTARLRAQDVAALLESGTSPSRVAVGDDDDFVVQVVDSRGVVIAASANVRGEPPFARLRAGESAEIEAPVDDGPFLAVAESAPDRGLTVLVARTLETVNESTTTVGQVLMIGCPLLLLLVGVTTWRIVGVALTPVDAIRHEVEEISASQLHRRVPVPAGRDEIARLAATMNLMLDRLEGAQARERRFISDASHELRSPVASIRQRAELALAHPDRATVPDLAAAVLDEDLRIQRLIEDLLVLARADEGMLELRPQAVDLDDIVFEEARRLRESASTLVDTTGVSAGRVSGDPNALRRVVRNLAENAARYGARRVAFSLRERDGRVALRIDDDGPGIPEGERDRVLERFVRLDGARARDNGGTGLGLAIVAELVAAHAGRVTVAESEMGGTRVDVSFSSYSAAP